MRNSVFLVALIFLFSGCASVRQLHNSEKLKAVMDSSSSVYIVLPKDALYGSKVCTGSGNAIAQLTLSAFLNHTNHAEVSLTAVDLPGGLAKAKEKNFNYLVLSKINLWEDHVTEWNGAWDNIQMDMSIYDVQKEALLDSTAFEGHGTWVTFGGYHPQNIVSAPIKEYVASLFK